MQVIQDLRQYQKTGTVVATNGTFDGVHLGHQIILKRLIELAKEVGGESVVLTFWPHPRFVLQSDQRLKLLSTFEERCALLARNGIDKIVRIPFTREFSNFSSNDFIQKILVDKVGVDCLVIGYDHRFGKNREGSFEYLVQNSDRYGFEIEEIPKHTVDDISVSSTKIRQALWDGDVIKANNCLGHRFSIQGSVVRGKMLGRELGFPTANINIPELYKLIPRDGVYAVLVEVEGDWCKGMLNIGFRPTVGGTRKTIEVNLFDFSQDIYGRQVTIFFVDRIRDERKFESIEELSIQLGKDQDRALTCLSSL